jgi:pyruvate kinase
VKNEIRFSVKPSGHTKTRIMATVGKATLKYETLRDMVRAGATFFRFNGAHFGKEPEAEQLTYEAATEIAGHIKRLRNELRQLIGIYFDLGGPKIRIQHVLVADTRRRPEPHAKEKCLQPPDPADGPAEVLIWPYNARKDSEFKQRLAAHGGDTSGFWDDDAKIRTFYGATDHYELMFGDEVTHLDGFAKGGVINLKDGWCKLQIEEIVQRVDRTGQNSKALRCVVKYRDSKFEFRQHQGANPYRYIFEEIITTKDIEDIEQALLIGADIISLSFVCSPYDADALKDKVNAVKRKIDTDPAYQDRLARQSSVYREYIRPEHHIPLFAKIETAFAVDYEECKRYAEARRRPAPNATICDPLKEIADRFDGLMVARGDLAVEVEKYAVPSLQRRIIEVARRKNKPVIVATEMLESMKRGDTSTRAEIGDINTAVHQEADILMLSGETASTKGRPEDAVAEMRAAIRHAEEELRGIDDKKNLDMLEREREEEIRSGRQGGTDAELAVSRLSQGAQVCLSARALKSEAVIASAQTGETVREIAYYRPSQKIIAITEDVLTAIRLVQHRGVYPVVMQHPLTRTVDEFVEIANQIHKEIGIPVPPQVTQSFRLPGLIRITSHFSSVSSATEIPNSIHEFTLPVNPAEIVATEVERKYVLSEQAHQTLSDCLKADALSWRLIHQANTYFTDMKGALDQANVMVRMRVERLIECDSPADLSGHRDRPAVFLTLKGKGHQEKRTDGFEEREEHEFDVTNEYLEQDALLGSGEADFSKLPMFYREHIAKKWGSVLSDKYQKDERISYRKQAVMHNHRLRCAMSNGFILELDRSVFPAAAPRVEYELEVELHGDASTARILNEFIHDKFAWLNIPIVQGYPAKLVRTYFYARVLSQERSGDVEKNIEEVQARLVAAKGHAEGCEKCQKLAELEKLHAKSLQPSGPRTSAGKRKHSARAKE